MGYRVIGLTLAPSPYVRFEPVDYPASEIYHYKPLDELVPVYQRPFRLLREAVIEATSASEKALSNFDALTLTGTFDYQACDHTVCYPPVSLPLSFTLDLEAHDNQRAKRR